MSERPGIMTLQVIGITKRNLPSPLHEGFPGGASGKEPACQCRRQKRCGFHPWVRKLPWRRARQPTPVILAWRIPKNRGGWRAAVHGGHKESDTTGHLNTHSRKCSSWRSLEVLCFLNHKRKGVLMAFSGRAHSREEGPEINTPQTVEIS